MKRFISRFLLFVPIIFLMNCVPQKPIRVSNLRCEYLQDPIGVDVVNPRFTWEISTTPKSTDAAHVFQVNIASSPELLHAGKADIWKSEKIVAKAWSAELPREIKLQSFKPYYWSVTAWTDTTRKATESTVARFETGMMSENDWSANWITDNKDMNEEAAPLFRKSFNISEKEVDFARMYICGLGYYETFINGQRVGTNYLDPAYTAFDKRVYYVTHDITSFLKKGTNSVATVLGNGWYNEQSVAEWNFHQAAWRNRPRMICEIHVRYKDGSLGKIVTDETWKTSTGGYTYNNIYSGDMFDARLEEKGWKTELFDDSNWDKARVISDFQPIIQSQLFPPIRISKEIEPVRMNKFSDTLYVFDLGENFSGFSSIKVIGEPETKIWLKHGELLDSAGRLNQANLNFFYYPLHEKEKFQTEVFILNGNSNSETFMPSFTYHGFRYVEVESDKPIHLTKNDLKGHFLHTDVKPVGRFSCSNETLNKLWRATNQSYLSNLHSIPTDCPQREKNGWTADAHVAIDAALMNFDALTIYEKWMRDFVDNQQETGMISGIIPSSGWGYADWIGPVWDAALFIIPNELYNYYGDSRIIEQLYPVMEKYLNYLEIKEKDGLLQYGLGDWVPFNSKTPIEYTSSAYYYLDYSLMARFAEVLKKDSSPYKSKALKIKDNINSQFYNSEANVYANGTQTAQAVALYLNLVPNGDEQKVADKLAENIKNNNDFLDFGLLGTKTVPRMLTKYGYGDLALKMIARPESPSWGYWVDSLNYTTLPESWRLNSNNRDASLNHVFFGDVSAWMYQYLGGINFDSSNPGFKNILIQPYFIEGIDWVKSEYQSVKGLIRSDWVRSKNTIELEVEIPGGTTAEVKLADKVYKIGSGKHRFNHSLR